MATKISISIADSVYWEIEKYRPDNISRSEFYEELLREALIFRRDKYNKEVERK